MKINQLINETTTAGAIATVEAPMNGMASRYPKVKGIQTVNKLMKGKTKKKGPYANSMVSENKMKSSLNDLREEELSEDDLIIVPGQNKARGFIPKQDVRTDREVEMAKGDLFQCIKNAKTIFEMIADISEEDGIEGWVQEKIIKASDYLNTVREYMEQKRFANEMTGGVIGNGMAGESIYEGKMKDLVYDLEDPELSEKHFKQLYGMSRREAREAFSKTNQWDFPEHRDHDKPLHEQDVAEGSDRDMASELQAEIRKSEKMRNATRLYYYKWAMKEPLSGVSSYENFINSWAGIRWFKKHKSDIEAMTNELNHRFLKNYKIEVPNEDVAEGSLTEMDKSSPQPGRDGKVSHKTYGSRDNYKLGDPERMAKQVSAEKAKKDALDILKKQGVAEGYQDDSKEREENLRYARSRNPVADAIRKKLNPNQKPEKSQGVAEGKSEVTCGCGSECTHCGGKHSRDEVGKKCSCCGNMIKLGVGEGWSQKYKDSINCSHPKGFSQKAHCAGKKKHNESITMETGKQPKKNPYAIGMAQAMKSTGDQPPLKKSTIIKAHEIAKSIKNKG